MLPFGEPCTRGLGPRAGKVTQVPDSTTETKNLSSIARQASFHIANIHLQPFLVNETEQTVEENGNITVKTTTN